jgi:hypothetical protein
LVGLAYHLLQPDYLEYQQLKQEGKNLAGNMKRYEKYTASTYQLPIEPSQAELTGLEKKIPIVQNRPEYVVQLEQAVKTSGATWVKMELLDDIAQVLAAKTASTNTEEETTTASATQPKENGVIPPDASDVAKQLGIVPSEALKPIWVKLEVKATKSQFPNLLNQLQQGERLVTVVGWDYQWTDETKAEPGVVYLALYTYQDEQVKKNVK